MICKWLHISVLVMTVLVSTAATSIAQGAMPSDEDWLNESCTVRDEFSVTQEYHICLGNKKIGDYTTIQRTEDGLTYYCGRSTAEIWLFGKIRIHYELECVFDDSVLLYATCTGYRNGRQRLHTEIMKDDCGWIARQDAGPWSEHYQVNSSMIKLYYEEPQVGDKTIIEATLVTKDVISKEGETYLLREPGKKGVSEVIYSDGILERVNVHYALFDFSVVRKEMSGDLCDCSGKLEG